MNRILLVNYGYYPAKKYGGPVNSIQNFCDLLGKKYECFLITCDHEIDSRERLNGIQKGWNKRGNCKVVYLPDCDINYSKIKKLIDSIEPQIIYIQSFFEYKFVIPILCINRMRQKKIPVIIAPRGDLCEGAMRKKYKKIPYICALKICGLFKNVKYHSTSNDETEAIRKYLGGNSCIYQIENVPSCVNPSGDYSIKKKDFLNAVYVSRIVPKKNLLQAVKLVKLAGDNISFDIYGPIEDKDYWAECINEMGSRGNIRYCGMLNHDEVYNVFNNHDLFFFPTLSENYGHVIVEAMQCGCPVLISDQTPWNDVAKFNAGAALSLNDEKGFVDQLRYYSSLDSHEYEDIRKNALKYINTHINIRELESEYIKMIEDNIVL